MAVELLSNPIVRGSQPSQNRSFLEKKGLNKKEMDEAFQRVPDPIGHDMSSHSTSLRPARSESACTTTVIDLCSWFYYQIHISGKNWVVSRLKRWIRKVALEDDDGKGKFCTKPCLSGEVFEVAKSANIVAKASLEMLNSNYDGKLYCKKLLDRLNAQVAETKGLRYKLEKMLGIANTRREISVDMKKHIGPTYLIQTTATAGRSSNFTMNSGSSWNPRAVRSASLSSKSFRKHISNVRGNFNQQPPKIAPRRKPWEVGSAIDQSRTSQSNERSQAHEALGHRHTSQSNESDLVPWWRRKVHG